MSKSWCNYAMSMHSVAKIKSFYDFVMQVGVKLRSFTDLYYLQEAQAYQVRSDDKHQRLKTVLSSSEIFYISHFGTTQLILLLYWWSVFLRRSNHTDRYTLGCSRPSNSHHQDHYSCRLADLLLERGACQDTQWNSEFRFWCFHRPKFATLLGYPASALQQSKGWQGGVKAPWPMN